MDIDVKMKNKIWGLPMNFGSTCLQPQMTSIDSMMLFTTKNGEMGHRDVVSNLYFVKKVSWIDGKHQRNLANEAVGTFLSLQKDTKDVADGDINLLLIKKSREYRSMIQACVAEMNEVLEKGGIGTANPAALSEDLAELKGNCELLYKMELVLGLVEIIFIDSRAGGLILNQLLSWIRLHFPQCTLRLSDCLASENPSLHTHYWDTCYGLILQGFLEEARKLLNTHPDKYLDPFLSIDELLRKMPTYVVYSGISEAEFSVRWQHWQSECKGRLEKGEFATVKQLEIICKILCGDLSTMVSLNDVLDTWYHLLVSYQLYTNPTVKLHRLASAAQDAIISFGVEDQISSLDHLLLSVLEVNDHQVIKQSLNVLDNLWFSVHLTDLLHHAKDNNSESSNLSEIRESLLIDYGSDLVSQGSLWQVGLMYLDWCGDCSALPIVETVLQRLPLSDNNKALKVIQAATNRGLDHIAHGICRVMGRRALGRGHLGSAIWWGVRSKDADFTSHLAHKILLKYMSDGQFDSSSLLDHLGPEMLLSETLTFLSKYREFHTLYQEGNLKGAASLLVSLIASKMAPEYFWPVLLEDSLPLLQSQDPVFTMEQTYNLMYCLHNIQDKKNSRESREKEACSTFFDREAEVRLALTNNLARTIIQEGTVER